MQPWTGCIAGALTEPEFRAALAAAGLTDIEIRPTHRVHDTRPPPSSAPALGVRTLTAPGAAEPRAARSFI